MKLKNIVEELNELKSNKDNIFYSKALNKNVYVYFELIVCLGDQPERRSINYMVRGGGNFGSRFGYSANINQIKKLPSCTNCLNSMMCGPFFCKILMNALFALTEI